MPPPTRGVIFRVDLIEFFQNARGNAVIDNIVSQNPEVSRPLNRVSWIFHSPQPENLFVKIGRECLHIALQFFSDKRFQNSSEGIFCTVPLEAGCLIDKRNDPNTSKASH